MKLDEEKALWKDDTEKSRSVENANGDGGSGTSTLSQIAMPSRNPLLKNITDYLIEEASAEEEELLGIPLVDVDPLLNDTVGGAATVSAGSVDGSENGAAADGTNANGTGGLPEGSTLERDEELIKVLDRLLFYLRIVHSTDYYSHSEYPSEDEMPNRIGLIHARGLFSSARVAPSEIADYIKEMETKVAPLLLVTPIITPEEARKLGLKEIEEAVEQFIKENTKELGEG